MLNALLVIAIAAVAPQKAVVTPPPLVRTNTVAPPIVSTPVAPPPIITPIARPRAVTFGSWQAQDHGDYTLARTENESGSVFGMLCGKTCVYFVNFKKDCHSGDDYPAMINAPGGSFSITLRCYHIEERRVLTFQVNDTALNMLGDQGEVGFAIPLQSGQFGVSRFSLRGGLEAIGAAVESAAKKRDEKQEGLRDFTV